MKITITTEIGGSELYRTFDFSQEDLEDDTNIEEVTGQACLQMIKNITSVSEPY